MKSFFFFLKHIGLSWFFPKKAKLLLTPGPVMLSPEVKKALKQDMEHHRSPEFKKVLKEVQQGLKEIFQTKESVLILGSTGTGAMEAGLTNTLSPKDEVLCVCAGKFGERWKEIALAHNLKVHSLEVPWGQAVSPEKIKEKLSSHKNIRALLISACETSTATEHPIQEISQILKDYPEVLFIVDGITGLGAMELKMDLWGLDVLLAGSQKSFGLPTGLSFIALSKKAWRAVETSSSSKYYFNLKKEKSAQEKGQTAYSSSVTLVRALKENLKMTKKQGGLQKSILKCQSLKESTLNFCKELGLKVYSNRPANSVTAVELPEGFSADEIKKNMEKFYGIILAGGQGKLKGKILRIGHLGPLSFLDHLKALSALARELNKQSPLVFNRKKIDRALFSAKKTLKKS